MAEVYLRTRVDEDPNNGFRDELNSAPDAETLFNLTIASFVREAERVGVSLLPGDAKWKALDVFQEMANQEYSERRKQESPELFVESGDVEIDPVGALGRNAVEGGVAVLPGREMTEEIL